MKKTIKREVIIEQELSKSKFIGYLAPITSEDAAKEYLKRIKKEHPKATHHCSAFVCGAIERSNDDGEPASSAGLPMLQVLRGHDLEGVIAVVVRYYGGIQLGVGGLIRAYGSSISMAIDKAIILIPKTVFCFDLEFPYTYTNDVETHLGTVGLIVDRRYDAQAIYRVEVQDMQSLDALNDFTSGTIKITYLEQRIDYGEVLDGN